MAQLEHVEAIEKRLWGAADTLRANSNFASNEYFLPVMGLIFLRHAYRRFLAIKDDIEANLPSRGGITRELTKEDFSQRSAMILHLFEEHVSGIQKQTGLLNEYNERLSSARDLLLPRLMNGEVMV